MGLTSINEGVVYFPKEVAFRELSEKKGAQLTEFVNLWRSKTGPSWDRMRTPAARRGMNMAYVSGTTNEITRVTAMPIDLGYDVWFWTLDLDILNQVSETYLLWQHANPYMSLTYADSFPMELDLHFGDMVYEGTQQNMYNEGEHHILHVPLRVDGWIPSSSTSKLIETIIMRIWDEDDLESPYEEVIPSTGDNYDAEVAARLILSTRTITSTSIT